MPEQRQDYGELKDMIKDVYDRMEKNKDQILQKFDDHKEKVCTPARIKFSSDIRELKVKSGIFGIIGGFCVLGIKYLISK